MFPRDIQISLGCKTSLCERKVGTREPYRLPSKRAVDPESKTEAQSLVGSPTWRSWIDMLSRCTNPKNAAYSLYKGRAPDARWHDFANFLADMGEKPNGYSLERVHNDRAYSKDNCIWISKGEQTSNTSRTVWVTLASLAVANPKTLKEACTAEGVNYGLIRSKLSRGKPLVEALRGRRRATKDEVTARADEILAKHGKPQA